MAKYSRDDLTNMKVEELVQVASDEFDATFENGTKKADMIDLLLEMQEESYNQNTADITDPDAPEQEDDDDDDPDAPKAPTDEVLAKQRDAARRAKDYRGAKDKKFRLKIFRSEGPGGSDDVKLQINGHNWRIKRDKEVTVPQRVVTFLEEGCIESRHVPDENGEMVLRDMPRFNFTAKPAE